MTTLVLLTGPPATGKSTLADRAAESLSAPVLGWDWAMAALTEFETIQEALRGLSHLDHRRVGWSILWNTAIAQLRRGTSVVLDGVAREAEIARTRDVAKSNGAACLVVVTSCADTDVHRQRVEGRVRGIPGWHELDWKHVASVLEGWEPPSDADLYLDALNPLEANLDAIGQLIARSRTG